MATAQALSAPVTDEQDQARVQQLYNLGITVAQKRSDAIEYRKQSGIEEEWAEDEEYYGGIDEANRSDSSAWRTRPPGQLNTQPSVGTRSTVFVNITGPYVDTAAASMADMLLPVDERGWAIMARPVPELAALATGKKIPRLLLLAAAQAYPIPFAPAPVAGSSGVSPTPSATGAPPAAGASVPLAPNPIAQDIQQIFQARGDWVAQHVAKANSIIEIAAACAQKAEKRIEDWHIECQFHREIRDSIHDAARIGTAVLKGPIPFKQRGVMFRDNELIIEEKIQPKSKRIPPWSLYPDPACGENIHNGSYIFEEDDISERQLTDLIDLPGYIKSEILACIKEGPKKAIANPSKDINKFSHFDKAQKKFQVWYMYGYLTREDLIAAGCEDMPDLMRAKMPAIVTMVNDRVIRASMNPLDSGDFPYDVMPWKKRAGHWAGKGVAREMRTQQKQVNAGWRSLMDNAGLASGPMIIFRQGMVWPSDGVAELRPRKVWLLAEDADARIDAEKAIGVIKVDMMVNELMVIITEAIKLAEIVTGLPALQLGQQSSQPETLGAMQMRNNGASVVRRRIARLFDDHITEPHVQRYYRWLLQYGDDDSEKGDFIVDARGSSALVQRDLQGQALTQLISKPLDPNMRVDPARLFAEWAKGQYIDPKKVQFTDAEWEKRPAPPPPLELMVAQENNKGRLAAAQATGQAWVAREQAIAQGDAAVQAAADQAEGDRTVAEAHIATTEQQFEAAENEKDRQLQLVVQHSEEYIEQMKQDGATAETVAQLKAMLAATTMKLQTERTLAAAANAQADDHAVAKHIVNLHKHSVPPAMKPPVEVPGRASNGHQFDQTSNPA